MEDDLLSPITGTVLDTSGLSDGSAPVSPTPTAVNTSQAANGSGGLFNSIISGLSGLTQDATTAYKAVSGTPITTSPAPTIASTLTSSSTVLIVVVFGALLFVILLVARGGSPAKA